MALALEAYGAPGYEVRAYKTRQDALRDAATAIETTGSPVILLAWRGAHTWVMTGFRADADPAIFPDATVAGAYIVDPWYPARLEHLGTVGPARDVPGQRRDGPELPRLEAARGPLPRTATACSSPSSRPSRSARGTDPDPANPGPDQQRQE